MILSLVQELIRAMSTHATSRCEIRNFRGKPTLFVDGEPRPSYFYCDPLDIDRPRAKEIHRRFADHGCRVFAATVRGGVDGDWFTTAFWTDDNEFPEVTDPATVAALHVSRQANAILEICPEARFWVRFQSATPPVKWRVKNPDDLLLDSYGKRFDEPSLASDSYVEQVGKYVANTVRFCERQPWADHIIGYLVYPLGEGTTVLTCEGSLFDRSPVMQRYFREFLRRTYATDAALCEAWGHPGLSLDTVAVPDDREFLARGATNRDLVDTASPQGKKTPHRLHWPEPQDTAAEKDYCRCMRELTKRYLQAILSPIRREAPKHLAGIDAFKQSMLGWPLVPRLTGDYQAHQGLMHAVSGAFGMAEFLDLPELDVVATPHDYLYRGMGFGYEGECIGDSVVAHGKMMLMEEDQRTDLVPAPTFNPLRTGAETQAGLWRNLGASLSRGYNTYVTEMCGAGSWFSSDEIQQVLAARARVHQAATGWDRKAVPSVVMVVDDWSVLEEDFTIGYQYLAVIHQRLFGMSRCGVPYRLHLLEDLARDDFPTCHKLFLFPNLFRVTPERLELLRRKVFCNGNVAVFGPASGITDGTRLSAESATELTGIPLELVRKESPRFVTLDRFEHPLTRDLPRLDFGDSFAYGPILAPCEHPEVTRLGGIQWPLALDGAGLVVREFGRGAAGNGRRGRRGAGDYATVFSCAVPLPEALLRSLARFSGTHVYSETDDLIFADSCSLSVHSVRPGKRRLKLPQRSVVWDLIRGQCLGEVASIPLQVTPPQTDLYFLGDRNPLAGP